jgi:phosphatidylserine/phosphatidylglycerophosphate/cardiolipin synthase-like enzyme
VDHVYVQPGDGQEFILEAIRSAAEQVDVAMYILTENEVEEELIDAQNRGVTVRVLLDGDVSTNGSAINRLAAGGIEVRSGPSRFTHYHVKTIMVDVTHAYVMTLNVSYSAFHDNREYALRISSPAELQDLRQIFDADWDDRSSTSVESPLVVSPNNSRPRLLALLGRARLDVLLTVETFSDTNIRAALRERLDAGIQVRVLLAHPDDVDQNGADAQTLAQDGFQVRFLQTPTMHAKLVVVDGALAMVGSVNLTRTSLDQNREVAVLVEDAAAVATLAQQAEADWAHGS